jgi:hypothetical protein
VVALYYGVPVFQAELAKAQRNEAVAKTDLAKREAAERKLVDMQVTARQLGSGNGQRNLVVTVQIANMGNRSFTVPAANLKGLVHRLDGFAESGEPVFEAGHHLVFGRDAETEISEIHIDAGETRKYETLCGVSSSGIHLISTKLYVRDPAPSQANPGEQLAYGASTYLEVE